MDLQYKPPLQDKRECRSLEDNYLNCLFQKALKDNVTLNRCVLDSILWFHLECPKAAGEFDDPVKFKRKFRNFFIQNAQAAKNQKQLREEVQSIKKDYDILSSYPEDIKAVEELLPYQERFKKYDHVNQGYDANEDLDI